MAELSMVDRWVRFRPLYCGLYLDNLSCATLVIAVEAQTARGEGDQM